MASNKIYFTETALEIVPTGANKLLGFRRKIVLPYEHLRRASLDYGMLNGGGGWRILGTGLPGKQVGLFGKNDITAYINLSWGETPLLLEVAGEIGFDQLILGVENPMTVLLHLQKRLPELDVATVSAPGPDGRPVRQTTRASKTLTILVWLLIGLAILASIFSGITGLLPTLKNLTLPIIFVLVTLLLAVVVAIFALNILSQQMQKANPTATLAPRGSTRLVTKLSKSLIALAIAAVLLGIASNIWSASAWLLTPVSIGLGVLVLVLAVVVGVLAARGGKVNHGLKHD